jgi:hypothetical protein
MQSESLAACPLPWCRVIHADTTPHNLTVGVENPASEPPALAGFAYPTLNLRFTAFCPLYTRSGGSRVTA